MSIPVAISILTYKYIEDTNLEDTTSFMYEYFQMDGYGIVFRDNDTMLMAI